MAKLVLSSGSVLELYF